MKKLITGFAVVLLFAAIGFIYPNNDQSSTSVLKISSTSEGGEVEFNLALMTSADDLELKKMNTPVELDLSGSEIAGYLLEKLTGEGNLHVELYNENGHLTGTGNSLIITRAYDRAAVSVIR